MYMTFTQVKLNYYVRPFGVMGSLKLVAGIGLIVAGIVFVNPFASGVGNFCTTIPADQLLFDRGCNIHWSFPTYPIFIPLFAGGIVFIGWAVRDMRRPTQIQSH
jgi:hypothetical protein